MIASPLFSSLMAHPASGINQHKFRITTITDGSSVNILAEDHILQIVAQQATGRRIQGQLANSKFQMTAHQAKLRDLSARYQEAIQGKVQDRQKMSRQRSDLEMKEVAKVVLIHDLKQAKKAHRNEQQKVSELEEHLQRVRSAKLALEDRAKRAQKMYEDEVATVVEINRQLQEATAALDLKESKLAESVSSLQTANDTAEQNQQSADQWRHECRVAQEETRHSRANETFLEERLRATTAALTIVQAVLAQVTAQKPAADNVAEQMTAQLHEIQMEGEVMAALAAKAYDKALEVEQLSYQEAAARHAELLSQQTSAAELAITDCRTITQERNKLQRDLQAAVEQFTTASNHAEGLQLQLKFSKDELVSEQARAVRLQADLQVKQDELDKVQARAVRLQADLQVKQDDLDREQTRAVGLQADLLIKQDEVVSEQARAARLDVELTDVRPVIEYLESIGVSSVEDVKELISTQMIFQGLHTSPPVKVTSRNMEAVIRLDIDVDTCKSSDFSNKENVNASKGRKESDASKEDCSLERGLPFSAGDRTLVLTAQYITLTSCHYDTSQHPSQSHATQFESKSFSFQHSSKKLPKSSAQPKAQVKQMDAGFSRQTAGPLRELHNIDSPRGTRALGLGIQTSPQRPLQDTVQAQYERTYEPFSPPCSSNLIHSHQAQDERIYESFSSPCSGNLMQSHQAAIPSNLIADDLQSQNSHDLPQDLASPPHTAPLDAPNAIEPQQGPVLGQSTLESALPSEQLSVRPPPGLPAPAPAPTFLPPSLPAPAPLALAPAPIASPPGLPPPAPVPLALAPAPIAPPPGLPPPAPAPMNLPPGLPAPATGLSAPPPPVSALPSSLPAPPPGLSATANLQPMFEFVDAEANPTVFAVQSDCEGDMGPTYRPRGRRGGKHMSQNRRHKPFRNQG